MSDDATTSRSQRAQSKRDWSPHIRSRLASLRLSPMRENEIVEELSQHVDERWRELVTSGASEDEATALALAEFRERDLLAPHLAPLRQAQTPEPITPGTPARHVLGDLWQDLRYAARTLRKRPTFALAATLTLALGIGSNAAIFTIVHAVLLRPLPLPSSERLQAVYTRFLPPSGLDFPYFGLSGPELADIRSHVTAYSTVAGYSISDRSLLRETGEARRVSTMQVTSGFFDVLGLRPTRGRMFTEEEAQRGGSCLALLSENASDATGDPIGSIIRLDDVPCEVIGVVPADVASVSAGLNPLGGARADRITVWTPLAVNMEDTPNNRGSHQMLGIARLREDASASLADAQMQALREYWSATYPAHHAKGHFAVSRPLQEDIVGTHRAAWELLGGAATFVLLIVCVNIAALLVSNAEARRRELAVRHALGASRRRLIRQMAAEAMVLAVAGGFLGVVLAEWLLAGLLLLYPQRLPVSHAIAIDGTAVLYTCALVIVVGLLVGLVPALQATGARLQETLRTDSRTASASRRAVLARAVLVVAQLAVSVILLVGALLLIRAYQRLQHVDLGVRADRVLTFGIIIPHAHQEDIAARRTLEAIEARLLATPGVESVGGMSSLPLAGAGPLFAFRIENRPEPGPGETPWNVRYLTVMPGVFRTLSVPLKRGRLLDNGDIEGRPLVTVINEAAARLYWPGDDPVGHTIRFNPQATNPSIQIVGVVGDIRALGPDAPVPPTAYLPLGQSGPPPVTLGRIMRFVVRTARNPADMAASTRAAVASVDPGLPPLDVRPMTEVVSAASGQPRFTTLVMSIFAGIAFLLAALGLYGILAYNVEQRTREIGVRVALGASRGEVLRLIIGYGMRLTVIGVLVGVPAALIVTRLIDGVLPGVARADPVIYAAVIVSLAISALMASYLPARRATRIDPLAALRSE